MARRRSSLTLLTSLVISLLLHGFVLVPALVGMMKATAKEQPLTARFDPDAVDDPEHEGDAPPEILPGIAGSTHSTLTWIGYEEYEEHLARLAEIDQAAFTDTPVGEAVQVQPSPSVPPTPEAIAQADPVEASPDPAEASPAIAEEIDSFIEALTTAEVAAATSPEVEGSQIELEARLDPGDVLASLTGIFSAIPTPAAPKNAIESQTPKAPTEGESGTQPREPTPEKATPGEAAPPKQVDKPIPPAPSQPVGESDPADVAEQESDATSVIDVAFKDVKLGKPIARPGLELRPARPDFEPLQRVTAGGRNPVVEIQFGRDGKPTRAFFHVRTGNRGLDAKIESSLYRWRAVGKDLDRLGAEDVIGIRIKIVLHPIAR